MTQLGSCEASELHFDSVACDMSFLEFDEDVKGKGVAENKSADGSGKENKSGEGFAIDITNAYPSGCIYNYPEYSEVISSPESDDARFVNHFPFSVLPHPFRPASQPRGQVHPAVMRKIDELHQKYPRPERLPFPVQSNPASWPYPSVSQQHVPRQQDPPRPALSKGQSTQANSRRMRKRGSYEGPLSATATPFTPARKSSCPEPCSESPGFSTEETVSGLIKAYGGENRSHDVDRCFNLLRVVGKRPGRMVYEAVLEYYVKQRDPEKVSYYLGLVIEDEVKINRELHAAAAIVLSPHMDHK